eukprot:7382381-Prymnesium_polylepis.1
MEIDHAFAPRQGSGRCEISNASLNRRGRVDFVKIIAKNQGAHHDFRHFIAVATMDLSGRAPACQQHARKAKSGAAYPPPRGTRPKQRALLLPTYTSMTSFAAGVS